MKSALIALCALALVSCGPPDPVDGEVIEKSYTPSSSSMVTTYGAKGASFGTASQDEAYVLHVRTGKEIEPYEVEKAFYYSAHVGDRVRRDTHYNWSLVGR